HHRITIANFILDNIQLQQKWSRRLMVDMAPLIWAGTHHIPRDSFGELFAGQLQSEMLTRTFAPGAVFPTPRGYAEPQVTLRKIPDPEDKDVWAAHRVHQEDQLKKDRLLS